MPKIFRYIAASLWPEDGALRRERFFLIAAAAMLAAAWPPLPLGFLALVALVWPLDIISRKPFGRAFKSGYLFSFFFHVFSLYWIAWVTVPGTIAAIAIISLYSAFIWALFGAACRWRRWLGLVLLPFLWIGLEYFRSLFEIAFPWSNLSYTQGSYKAFIQICEFVGDLGISFLIVVINILIWRTWREHHRKWRAIMAITAGLIVVLPTIYGARVLSSVGPSDSGPIRVALLQGDVDLKTKWDPDKKDFNFALYDSLSLAAVKEADTPIDLIVWPETSAPAYLLGDYRLTTWVGRIARMANTPMLVGTLDYNQIGAREYETFNAAIQYDPSGHFREPYHKNKLVPFAETVPYGEYIPFLANLSLGWSDFVHGRGPMVYENDFGNYGTLICYEVIFPEFVNRYVREGADFLVNITNDTWYGYSSGPYQHAGMASFRAIENRICIARAANSGFSYFVDKYGRLYNKSALYERTILYGRLSPVEGRTFFNRTGPLLGRIGLLVIVLQTLILMVAWIKRILAK